MTKSLAWSDIHDLLPEAWQVGPTSYDPGTHGWSVTARAPKIGRAGKPPATITGSGEDELAALTDLVIRLREHGHPDRMAALERRMRLAYLRGGRGAEPGDAGAWAHG